MPRSGSAFCISAALSHSPSRASTISAHPCLTTTVHGQFAKRLRPTTVLNGDISTTLIQPQPVNYNPQNLPQTITPTASLFSSLTSIASTGAGIFILGFIVFIHEGGHYMAARLQGIRVKTFSIGFGPVLWSITPANSDTEFTIRLLPLGGYVAFPEHIKNPPSESLDSTQPAEPPAEPAEPEYDDDPNLLQNRPVLDRALVVSAGVIANIILAWVAIFTSVSAVGVPTYDIKPGVVISTIVDDSGAAVRDGLRASDIILSLNDRVVAAIPDSASQVAEQIRSSRGKPLNFSILRGGETMGLTVKPRCCLPDGSSSIGVQLTPNAKVTRTRPQSVSQSLARTNSEFTRLSAQTWRGLTSLFVNFKTSSQNLSGPIGVVSMGADLARNDTAALFTFCAVISLNLAIINSLPLPALDGGQMTFLIIEALRGTPVSLKVQDVVNRTALVLFLAFSGVLFFGDLERLNVVGALQKLFG